jgi:hypothetical protein
MPSLPSEVVAGILRNPHSTLVIVSGEERQGSGINVSSSATVLDRELDSARARPTIRRRAM